MTSRAITIFGATGDLAQRMLFPSLYFLDAEGRFEPDFLIVGASRSELKLDAFAAKVEQAVRARVEGGLDEAVWKRFRGRLRYVSVDAAKPDSFCALTDLL